MILMVTIQVHSISIKEKNGLVTTQQQMMNSYLQIRQSKWLIWQVEELFKSEV